MPSDTLRIIGVMSGTSADGIDAALLEISGGGSTTDWTLHSTVSAPYDPSLRRCVLEAAAGRAGPSELAVLHYRLGREYARAIAPLVHQGRADLIGLHGQTVAHARRAGKTEATLQLGCPAVLAAATGLSVVSDFRAADIARGGQGAPLVSFVDWLHFRHDTLHRVLLNIGGIANITYLPPGTSNEPPLAWDTGPGNAPLDRLSRLLGGEDEPFDRDGRRAAAGTVDDGLLHRLLQHPYLSERPPKSTGLETFGDKFVEELQQEGLPLMILLATATRFVAESIALAVYSLPRLDQIFVSGGGLNNATLLHWLRQSLAPIPVLPTDEAGMPARWKEAIAFALLANQTVRGLPASLPTCTGAGAAAVLGSITPGSGYQQLMGRLGG